MSTTNAAVYKQLSALGATATVLDTAAPTLERSILRRLGRLPRIISGVQRLLCLRAASNSAFYLSASGGWGQVYDVVFLVLARCRRMRIYVRHCCFHYLEEPTLLAKALVLAAGSDAVHITQSEGMADRLQSAYHVKRIKSISNAVLYPFAPDGSLLPKAIKTLGFLSNISEEKGVFDFLDLMAAAEATGLMVKGILAGPCQDQDVRRRVESRLRRLRNVTYLGAVYGADKERFFSSIDTLVLPTRYRNETEAKVNHEAMSRGIPVIAYGRGCIPEIVGSDCGLVVDPSTPFVAPALERIRYWLMHPAAFRAASKAAKERFDRTYMENLERWQVLLGELTGHENPPSALPPESHEERR